MLLWDFDQVTAIFLIENQYIDILEGVLHVTYGSWRFFVMIFVGLLALVCMKCVKYFKVLKYRLKF